VERPVVRRLRLAPPRSNDPTFAAAGFTIRHARAASEPRAVCCLTLLVHVTPGRTPGASNTWPGAAPRTAEPNFPSRHGGGEVFDRSDTGVFRSLSNRKRTLQLRDSHPVIYSAVSSHAHYPSPGNHNYERVYSKKWGLGTASADLFDRTAAEKEFRAHHPDHYRIISSDLPGVHVVEPVWLEFGGRWGQYEKLSDKIKFSKANIPVFHRFEVGNGPSGPKMKKEWKGDFVASYGLAAASTNAAQAPFAFRSVTRNSRGSA
jgi:VPS62-like protein